MPKFEVLVENQVHSYQRYVLHAISARQAGRVYSDKDAVGPPILQHLDEFRILYVKEVEDNA